MRIQFSLLAEVECAIRRVSIFVRKNSQIEKSKFPWILFLLVIVFFLLAAIERNVAKGFVSKGATVDKRVSRTSDLGNK
jgi:hypothetical protein